MRAEREMERVQWAKLHPLVRAAGALPIFNEDSQAASRPDASNLIAANDRSNGMRSIAGAN